MTSESSRSIETEIDALKVTIRRMKRALVCSLLAAFAIVMVTGLQPVNAPKTVEASRFVLKDRNNRDVVEMSSGELGLPRFRMFDTEGKCRLEFGITADAIEFLFNDEKGRPTLSLETRPGVGTQLTLTEQKSKQMLFWVGGSESAEASFRIFGEQGDDFELSSFPEGNEMIFFRPGGNEPSGSFLSLGTEKIGNAYLGFWDLKERQRLSIEGKPDGTTRMEIRGTEGKTLFKAP